MIPPQNTGPPPMRPPYPMQPPQPQQHGHPPPPPPPWNQFPPTTGGKHMRPPPPPQAMMRMMQQQSGAIQPGGAGWPRNSAPPMLPGSMPPPPPLKPYAVRSMTTSEAAATCSTSMASSESATQVRESKHEPVQKTQTKKKIKVDPNLTAFVPATLKKKKEKQAKNERETRVSASKNSANTHQKTVPGPTLEPYRRPVANPDVKDEDLEDGVNVISGESDVVQTESESTCTHFTNANSKPSLFSSLPSSEKNSRKMPSLFATANAGPSSACNENTTSKPHNYSTKKEGTSDEYEQFMQELEEIEAE